MKTIMKLEELETIDHLSQFLDGTQAVIFETVEVKKVRYGWIQHELVRFDYLKLSKAIKGLLFVIWLKFLAIQDNRLHALLDNIGKLDI